MAANAKTALIVDPNREVSAILPRVFERNQWTLEHAPNNQTALTMIQAKPYDLILTSEKTSAIEDVELLRKIRMARPHVRVIILSPRSTPKEVIAAMREHVFSY